MCANCTFEADVQHCDRCEAFQCADCCRTVQCQGCTEQFCEECVTLSQCAACSRSFCNGADGYSAASCALVPSGCTNAECELNLGDARHCTGPLAFRIWSSSVVVWLLKSLHKFMPALPILLLITRTTTTQTIVCELRICPSCSVIASAIGMACLCGVARGCDNFTPTCSWENWLSRASVEYGTDATQTYYSSVHLHYGAVAGCGIPFCEFCGEGCSWPFNGARDLLYVPRPAAPPPGLSLSVRDFFPSS